MSKKLVIRFVKFENALAMQVLEQVGLPDYKEDGGFVRIFKHLCLAEGCFYLRGVSKLDSLEPVGHEFESNIKRDEYLNKCVNAITDELFTRKSELKWGELCEVRDRDTSAWEKRIFIARNPSNNTAWPFIVLPKDDTIAVAAYRYCRPIQKRIEPTIDGDIYTWEEK